MKQAKRPEKLDGRTYQAEVGDDRTMFVTVNEENGQPFEVFVRLDDPYLYEWITLSTLLITRALRDNASLKAIADELCQIHSPVSGHHLPGGDYAPSIVAHLGRILREHKPIS